MTYLQLLVFVKMSKAGKQMMMQMKADEGEAKQESAYSTFGWWACSLASFGTTVLGIIVAAWTMQSKWSPWQWASSKWWC